VRADQITEVCTGHGEGAVWSNAWGGLRFVDLLTGAVLALASSGTVTRQTVGRVAACVRPRATGGMVVAVERGFASYDADGVRQRDWQLWADPGVRMNEGSCDPDGRFWCGSTAYDESPGAGSLYRLDVDGSTSTPMSGLTIPNGLGFSPDGQTAYHADSATQEVAAYDYDPVQGLVERRTFVRIAVEEGCPDGLTVDADGRVWVAIWAGGQVRCYSPSGQLEAVVEVAAHQTTSCTFGGPDLRDLYVTTSRRGLGESAEPGAGAVFAARPGAAGQPVLPFLG
jgi:sugar lactone lactonase YvrE